MISFKVSVFVGNVRKVSFLLNKQYIINHIGKELSFRSNVASEDPLLCCYRARDISQSLAYGIRKTQQIAALYLVNNNKNFCDFMNTTETPWQKLNTVPVCFGAKDDQFGSFKVEIDGSVNSVKLVHVSGEVTCTKWWLWGPAADAWSKFGCIKASLELNTLITTATNDILLPESQESSYTLPGYHPDSTEIVFTNISTPLRLSSGQQLRVWYGEDLRNVSEHDNEGRSCVDVYAKYM